MSLSWNNTEDELLKKGYLNGGLKEAAALLPNRSLNSLKLRASRLGISKRTKLNSDFFYIIDTESKAYWLGFLYADGHVNKEGTQVAVNLKRDDKQHLEMLANIFNAKVFDKETFDRRTNKTYLGSSVYISSVDICTTLKGMGFNNQKTYSNDTIVLSFVPGHLFNHFVRGFFDGYGTISSVINKEFVFSIAGLNVKILEAIRDRIVELLGISKREIFKGHCYSLIWAGNKQLLLLREWLYKDASIFLPRKKEKFYSIPTEPRGNRGATHGVTWDKRKGKWLAQIHYQGKTSFIGLYTTRREALIAYNLQAVKLGKPLNCLDDMENMSLSEVLLNTITD